jgi:hypothetical protein
MQLTHSLKAPGFNHFTCEMKNWFHQSFCFQIQRAPLHRGPAAQRGAHQRAQQQHQQGERRGGFFGALSVRRLYFFLHFSTPPLTHNLRSPTPPARLTTTGAGALRGGFGVFHADDGGVGDGRGRDDAAVGVNKKMSAETCCDATAKLLPRLPTFVPYHSTPRGRQRSLRRERPCTIILMGKIPLYYLPSILIN